MQRPPILQYCQYFHLLSDNDIDGLFKSCHLKANHIVTRICPLCNPVYKNQIIL